MDDLIFLIKKIVAVSIVFWLAYVVLRDDEEHERHELHDNDEKDDEDD